MRSIRAGICASTAVIVAVVCSQPARCQTAVAPRIVPRKLAPGVIISIEPVATEEETADGPRAFTELLDVLPPLDWQPNDSPATQTLREMARSVTFRREIWNLEFGFKPLRMIQVDGQVVWYLLYYVRNNGHHHYPEQQTDRTYSLKPVNHPIRFIPSFILQSRGLNRAYRDRVLPEVVSRIERRERPPGRLHDSSNIGLVRIPVSTEFEDHRIWGVATWENVDPRTDFISVYVQGLTNAYRWAPPEQGGSDDLSRNYEQIELKTLQLNFWRAGDAQELDEREILFGIPLYPDDGPRQQKMLEIYGLPKPLEHQWVYRPAGTPR